MTRDYIRAETQRLADDAFEGRFPGTPGGQRTVKHLIDLFESIALRPGGEQGRWTQTVPMRAVEVIANDTTLAFDAGGSSIQLATGDEIVASSFGPAGPQQLSAPLVFAGYGIDAPEQQWNDFDNTDVRGKVLVVFVGDPPLDDGRFAGKAMTYYGRWTYKYEQALRLGAAGCLIIHETAPASYGWQVVQNSWSGPRSHLADADAALPPALKIRGWISEPVARKLARSVGTTLEQWHKQAIAPSFRAKPLKAQIRGTLSTRERYSKDENVIGVVPGGSRSDEFVVITAHWDHLGRRDAGDGQDGIFNGAVDNASGTASLVAVAAQLQQDAQDGHGLARSVMVIATTAEEQGLLGSPVLCRTANGPHRQHRRRDQRGQRERFRRNP